MTVDARNNQPFDTSLWRALQEEKTQRLEAQRIATLEQAAKKVRAYFDSRPVDKVYLTGSLLHEGRFAEWSDIDVAVEGLKGDYLRTGVELERLLDRDVDLIELEQCRFRDAIEKTGLRLK